MMSESWYELWLTSIVKWWHSQAFKFSTNWSLNLLVKEVIKSANIGKITGRMADCVICPFALTLCPRRCRHRQISKITSVWRTEMLLIVVMLIGRLMWFYYQLISNCCRSVLTHWLTDWRRQWLADCWSRTVDSASFCCDIFFFVTPVVYS